MNKWDSYFHSHYMPKQKEWGKEDLFYYKHWYFAWIQHIDSKLHFKKVFSKKPKILEIGCGIGGVSALLVDRGWDVTGSDISRTMIKSAAKVNKRARFVYCDVQKKIPGKFSAIVGFEVLEHILEPQIAIKNIKNALSKNGLFIGSTPYPYKKNYIDPTHCSVMYPKKWKKLFGKAGFSDVKTYPMSFLPYVWRINKKLNIILPFYIPFPGFVSTTLIIAKK